MNALYTLSSLPRQLESTCTGMHSKEIADSSLPGRCEPVEMRGMTFESNNTLPGFFSSFLTPEALLIPNPHKLATFWKKTNPNCMVSEWILTELHFTSPWRARCIPQGRFCCKNNIPGDFEHVSYHFWMLFASFLCLTALVEQAASRRSFFPNKNCISRFFEHGLHWKHEVFSREVVRNNTRWNANKWKNTCTVCDI